VVEFSDLGSEEAASVLREMMRGETIQARIGAFLAPMRMRGETTQGLYGIARVVRECVKADLPGPSTLIVVGTRLPSVDVAITYPITSLRRQGLREKSIV
jgi:anthranilate phosphoribosyltransferase